MPQVINLSIIATSGRPSKDLEITLTKSVLVKPEVLELKVPPMLPGFPNSILVDAKSAIAFARAILTELAGEPVLK